MIVSLFALLSDVAQDLAVEVIRAVARVGVDAEVGRLAGNTPDQSIANFFISCYNSV